MATTWGLPGFRFVETPHPVAILREEETSERADHLLPLVVALLTAP
jgi:hypothetical protein